MRASHPQRNLDRGAPYLPLSICRQILMDSKKTVDLATVQRSSSFDKLKDIDLIGWVPRNLFEPPSPLTHVFSASGCGYLHEVLRPVRSDCHDVCPKEIDLLPLGSNRSSCDVLLSAKPVLRCDLRYPRIQNSHTSERNDESERKVARDSERLVSNDAGVFLTEEPRHHPPRLECRRASASFGWGLWRTRWGAERALPRRPRDDAAPSASGSFPQVP